MSVKPLGNEEVFDTRIEKSLTFQKVMKFLHLGVKMNFETYLYKCVKWWKMSLKLL